MPTSAKCVPLQILWRIVRAVFTAVTQGILVAGLSNYVNQIIKQIHKPE